MERASEISCVVAWLVKAVIRDAEAALEKSPEDKELMSLRDEVIKVQASLNTNSQSVYLQRVRDLAYNAQDWLDEWDYLRIQGEVGHQQEQQHGGNEEMGSDARSPPNVGGSEVSGISSISSSASVGPAGNEDSEDSGTASPGRGNKGSRLPSFLKQASKQAGNIFTKVKRTASKKIGGGAIRVPLTDMASRINDIVGSLQKARNEAHNASSSESLDSISLSNLKIQPKNPMQTTNSLFGEPSVFGRDKERDGLVVKLLTAHESTDNPALSVFSVVGSAGVGKTTLAQLVYDDPRVKTRFEVQMWVAAGFYLSAIRDEVLNKICDRLRSKRFLLVVDDLQEGYGTKWGPLLDRLKQSSSPVEGSVILVTNRVWSVKEGVSGSDIIHLYGLEDRDFWDLFKSFTFDDDWFDRNPTLEIIGRQIAKKLKGNPLLAKTISASLKRDLDKAHWRGVLDALNLEGGNAVSPVLKLSYQNLPFSLKQCFSYSSLYPKDYPFNRDDMVRSWIAHGFVEGRMEDVGREYFDSLVDQGFLKRVYKEDLTSVLSEYQTHDLMRDLVYERTGPMPSVVHHISIIGRKDDEHTKSLKGEFVRSFILVVKEGLIESNVEDNIASHIKEATCLRVLILNGTHNFPPVLTNTVNYVHLRYLSLDSDFERLPEEICKLYHLLFLDVSNCRKLISLPDNFNNLVKLRHFIAKEEMHSKISNVRKLTSLQELSKYGVKTESEFGIEQLGDLKDLGGLLSIYNLNNVGSKEEARKAKLVEKEFLNSLCLEWRGNGTEKEKEKETVKEKETENLTEMENKKEIEKDKEEKRETKIEKEVLEGLQPHENLKSLQISGYSGNNMPSWLNDTAKLVNILSVYLQNCSELEALPPLGQLPFLKKLHLKSLRKVKEIGSQLYGSSKDGLIFQSLEKMLIENMTGLEMWKWTKETILFPALQFLEVRNCPNLGGIPLSTPDSLDTEGIKRFPCLNTLVIHNCPKVEKIPPLPHTHRLSNISIKGVSPLFGELNLSVLRGEPLLQISSNHDLKSLHELLLFYNLRSLTSLSIKKCPNLISLGGEGLLSLVCLNNLIIEECIKLDSLPSDLTQLLSLEKVSILGCESVKSFPENDLPDSLKELHVDKCSPELHEIFTRLKNARNITITYG